MTNIVKEFFRGRKLDKQLAEVGRKYERYREPCSGTKNYKELLFVMQENCRMHGEYSDVASQRGDYERAKSSSDPAAMLNLDKLGIEKLKQTKIEEAEKLNKTFHDLERSGADSFTLKQMNFASSKKQDEIIKLNNKLGEYQQVIENPEMLGSEIERLKTEEKAILESMEKFNEEHNQN